MSSMKELQALCEASSIKFKLKTQAQLLEALKVNDVAGEATESLLRLAMVMMVERLLSG